MAHREYSVAVTTTGSAGSATGSGTISFLKGGHIEYVYLDFHASSPATTDTTIAYAATPPGGNILVVTNSATDALFWPRAKPVDNANAAITNAFVHFPASGNVTVSLAQCDALTAAVTAYIGVWS
jgi:hypothetical protein